MNRSEPKKPDQLLPPPLPKAPNESLHLRILIVVAAVFLAIFLLASLLMLLRNGSDKGDSAGLAGLSVSSSDVVATSEKSADEVGSGTSEEPGAVSESGRSPSKDDADDLASSANAADTEPSLSSTVESGNANDELVTNYFPAPSPQPALQFFANGSDADAQAGGDGKKAELFGIAAKGRRFVYVVDKSSSMSGEPFEMARDELLRSIKQRNANQSFFIFFMIPVPIHSRPSRCNEQEPLASPELASGSLWRLRREGRIRCRPFELH